MEEKVYRRLVYHLNSYDIEIVIFYLDGWEDQECERLKIFAHK
jgi:hypothetical protein